MKSEINKGGRPEKEADEKRERLVKIRFSPAEYNRLVVRKSTTQAKDLSDFIRTICLDKPMRMKPVLTSHQEQLLSISREMRADLLRIGVNINQSAKRINSTTDYHDLQREVGIMVTTINRIEADLIQLMETLSSPIAIQQTTNPLVDGRPDQ